MGEFSSMRTASKRLLGMGLLAALVVALWKAWQRQVAANPPSGVQWQTAPFPFPPAPRPATTGASATPARPVAPWVEPGDDGACPRTHPVKAKMRSGIYHVPGGASYDRTRPDRCYVDAAAAEADGLRAAKA